VDNSVSKTMIVWMADSAFILYFLSILHDIGVNIIDVLVLNKINRN